MMAVASLERKIVIRAPTTNVLSRSSRALPREAAAANAPAQSKKPARSATAAISIMPKKKRKMFHSPASTATASSGRTTVATTMAAAPTAAQSASLRRLGLVMTPTRARPNISPARTAFMGGGESGSGDCRRSQAGAGSSQEHLALAGVFRQRGGALEFDPRLVRAANPGEQVTANARQQVVSTEKGFTDQLVDQLEAC